MVWLLIALILVVAFGPLFYLRPSPRDRRLAALRAKAVSEGLVVEISHLEKRNASAEERVNSAGRERHPKISLALYRQPLTRKLRLLEPLRLQRDGDGRGEIAGWHLTGSLTPPRSDFFPVMSELLASMPQGVEAFDIDSRFVSVFWRESKAEDEAALLIIARNLRHAADYLQEVEAELELGSGSQEGASDDDSGPDQA
ncbi:MAG: hypothetical protein NXH85_05560 [Pseudomonadaceae bacterium]|nr:hypothetical protein [Pseudomonadaceae bacterium]